MTTKDMSSNPAHEEVYSIQYYVIKCDSDRSVVFSGPALRFPQLLKLTATITEILLKVALNIINQTIFSFILILSLRYACTFPDKIGDVVIVNCYKICVR